MESRDGVYTVKVFGGAGAFRAAPAAVAVFDMDGTLIRPKGDYVFPKTLYDWRWIDASVKDALAALYRNGHDLIIMTNQKKLSAADIATKAQMLYDDLRVPFVLVSGHKDEFYRKPHTGLWRVVTEQLGPVDLARSFFVGDMYTDAYFAHNVGLRFHWAGDYFKLDATGHAPLPLPLPHHVLEGIVHSPETRYASRAKHLVVLMGAPASGKSSIARQNHGYVLINRDTMKTDAKMRKTFEAALSAGQSVVVDNTNPLAATRRPWLDAAKAAGYTTTIIFTDLPKNAVMFLNAYRYEVSGGTSSFVPSVAYNIFYSKLERPVASDADEVITTQINVQAPVKGVHKGQAQ